MNEVNMNSGAYVFLKWVSWAYIWLGIVMIGLFVLPSIFGVGAIIAAFVSPFLLVIPHSGGFGRDIWNNEISASLITLSIISILGGVLGIVGIRLMAKAQKIGLFMWIILLIVSWGVVFKNSIEGISEDALIFSAPSAIWALLYTIAVVRLYKYAKSRTQS